MKALAHRFVCSIIKERLDKSFLCGVIFRPTYAASTSLLACEHVSPSDSLCTFWVHLTAAATTGARKVLATTAAVGNKKGQDSCVLSQTTCWPYDLLVDHFAHILE